MIGSRKKLKDIQCPLSVKPSSAISGEEISIIEHAKYLGVQMDQYMNWENRYKSCDKKDFKGLSRRATTGGVLGVQTPALFL